MAAKKRRYVMDARRRRVAETRTRIIDAIVALHEDVGPRRTTVSAIAERAGVERLTVYRHFPDEEAQFRACSHRFTELNPPPDPSLWMGESDPMARISRALEAVYGYFSDTQKMLAMIYRDADDYPVLKELIDGFDTYLRSLADSLADDRTGASTGRPVRVFLRHAFKFRTWQSLEEESISDHEKARFFIRWLES